MGFFNNFLNKLFAKPKTLVETLSESHPTSWYENKAANIFSNILKNYNSEGVEAAINLFCLKYFESFDNITQLKGQGIEINVSMLAKELTCYIQKIIDSQSDIVHQAFFASQLFKETKSPYIRFIKKLNHNFYGETAFYISELIFLGYIDVDKDDWLYDKALFAFEAKSDLDGQGLFEKVSVVLQQNNLLTEKILQEIEESMN